MSAVFFPSSHEVPPSGGSTFLRLKPQSDIKAALSRRNDSFETTDARGWTRITDGEPHGRYLVESSPWGESVDFVRIPFLSVSIRVHPWLTRFSAWFRRRGLHLVLVALFLLIPSLRADDLNAAFDTANKLFEQGRYPESAAAYEQLLQSGQRSATLYFNLGDAWFKAGQLGRAIAAWRSGERLAPRDPSLRFNLQFARQKVSGSEPAAGPAWQRALTGLTVNEWTVIAAVAIWLWFLLLALRELRPGLRNGLKGYTLTTGLGALALVGCVVAAANLYLHTTAAVVVVPEAIARSGPLEEAKVLHRFRDGLELSVLDRKELTIGNQKQTWLQVSDGASRTGWLRSDQVVVLTTRNPDLPSS
jgi:tetratricopeptide (TPR) repeat protein